jgi:protein SCO1
MSRAAIPALAAPEGEVRRKRLALGALGLGLVLLSLVLGVLVTRSSAPLLVLAQLPPFELVDERGARFGTDELKGHPYVADFIYTGCRDSCPRLTSEMAALQAQLLEDPGAVRLVSFSVDPVQDTPEKLLAYAKDAGAIPERWKFLTGPLSEVSALVEHGFKVAMLDRAAAGPALHDDHLVVVDGLGRVRGYYSGDVSGRRAIRSALKRLLWGE